MELMNQLALLLVLSSFAAAEPAPAVRAYSSPSVSAESSKIKLDAQDAAGALADAEIAVAKGGGAAAYAARGDAKRALGGRVDEAIADYAAAAKLDPRYVEKYEGLIAQKESARNPSKEDRSGKGLNGVPIYQILSVAGAGGLLLLVGGILLFKRKKQAGSENP
jgi:hypothetical protein